MCTIGASLSKGLVIVFKNCDLKKDVKFDKPKIKIGRLKYISFTRKGRPGVWAGINEKGLSIVGADSYTQRKYKAKPYMIHSLFKFCEDILAQEKTAEKALSILKKLYRDNKISISDIAVLADKNKAILAEYRPYNRWGVKKICKGAVFSTNHFKILKEPLSKRKKSDPEIRYETVKTLLTRDRTLSGIKKLLKDHKHGPSVNSICRHGTRRRYHTIASAIMVVNKTGVEAYYIINSSPCKKRFKKLRLR